jgi:hypothetical protein
MLVITVKSGEGVIFTLPDGRPVSVMRSARKCNRLLIAAPQDVNICRTTLQVTEDEDHAEPTKRLF